MLTGGEMLYVGIRRRDRFRIHGGVAIVLPVLQMVHEIKRQIGELRFQLAGDAFGFFGERGAVFCEPLRGLGALLRRFAARSSARRRASASYSVRASSFALRAASIFALRVSIKVSIG